MSQLQGNTIDIPDKYKPIWEASLPLLKQGRPGDDEHAAETVANVLRFADIVPFDPDVLIPVAMLHDIGHSAILPEHFKYVTGSQKVRNGKLVHMLAGAKIARDILSAVGYPSDKSSEIVEIISMHDADQLTGLDDWRSLYDTSNKQVFHDLDSLDRYNERRLSKMVAGGYYGREQMLNELRKMLDDFFYPEFRRLAQEELQKLENIESHE